VYCEQEASYVRPEYLHRLELKGAAAGIERTAKDVMDQRNSKINKEETRREKCRIS